MPHISIGASGRLVLRSAGVQGPVPAAAARATRRAVQVRAVSSSNRESGKPVPMQQPGKTGGSVWEQQHAAVAAAADSSSSVGRSPHGTGTDAAGNASSLLQSPLASAAVIAAVAAGISAVPLLLPTGAAASSALAALVPHSLQQHHYSATLLLTGWSAGAASLLCSLVCTARFLLSYYPALEQHVEQRRWALPWRAVTLFDPLLQPVRRNFFKQTEEGDLDYAAVALLAAVCSLLECLVGKDGLMLDYLPDFVLREALQLLVVFQHGMLLPCWVIVVLRWGKVM